MNYEIFWGKGNIILTGKPAFHSRFRCGHSTQCLVFLCIANNFVQVYLSSLPVTILGLGLTEQEETAIFSLGAKTLAALRE
jgi:hypothetical protein